MNVLVAVLFPTVAQRPRRSTFQRPAWPPPIMLHCFRCLGTYLFLRLPKLTPTFMSDEQKMAVPQYPVSSPYTLAYCVCITYIAVDSVIFKNSDKRCRRGNIPGVEREEETDFLPPVGNLKVPHEDVRNIPSMRSYRWLDCESQSRVDSKA